MTKREAYAEFRVLYPSGSFVGIDGRIDKPMRDQAWNDFTDALCKEGRITLRQYQTWHHPFNDR